MVTGSGFDLIQTAVMKVQGDNSIAFEVCVSPVSFSVPCTFHHLPLHLSISPLITHL